MAARRKPAPGSPLKGLASGPGRLCQALAIKLSMYGAPVDIAPLPQQGAAPLEIDVSKRINIDYAGEGKDVLWRFSPRGNACVSVKRPVAHSLLWPGAPAKDGV